MAKVKESEELETLEQIEDYQEAQKSTNKEIEKMDLAAFGITRLRGKRIK